jgi:alcohol dehydrogenase
MRRWQGKGSTMAGFAFGNSDVGAVHCISESIGALFDIPHGVANAVFLPQVMAFNLPACEHRYACIAEAIGLHAVDQTSLAGQFVSAVASLSRELKIPTFKQLGVDRSQFELVARYAFQNNSNGSNIRPATQQDYLTILEKAYAGL